MKGRFPAFVINLDRRFDRWRRIVVMCERAGISAIRLSAVDGTALSALSNDHDEVISTLDVTTHWNSEFNAQFDRKCTPNINTPLTLTERACAASHLKVWREISSICKMKEQSNSRKLKSPISASSRGGQKNVRTEEMFRELWQHHRHLSSSNTINTKSINGGKFFIILEDDASIVGSMSRKFQLKLIALLENVPDDVDILYLGAMVPARAVAKRVIFRGVRFLKLCYAWQLHAYVLTARAVETLLGNLPINGPVDNFIASLVHSGVLNAYMPERQLVGQQGGRFADRAADSNIRHSGRLVG